MKFTKIVHPGTVVSRNDGQTHYISFTALCELYGLNPNECRDASRPEQIQGINHQFVVHFRPRADGNYPKLTGLQAVLIMTEDEQYQAWLEELSKTCKCLDGPCGSCMQGAPCDCDN